MKDSIKAALVIAGLLALLNCASATASTNRESSECTAGDVSTNCKFRVQDGGAPNVWHDIDLYVGNNGDVSMTVDGVRYWSRFKSSRFQDGYNLDIYHLSPKGWEAEAVVTVKHGNEGDSVNVSISNVSRHAEDDLLKGLSDAHQNQQ